MGTTAEKLNYLKETKTEIKNALETPSNIFRDYPSLIKKYIDNQPTSKVSNGVCTNALDVPLVSLGVDGQSYQGENPSPDNPQDIEVIDGANLLSDENTFRYTIGPNGAIIKEDDRLTSDYIEFKANKEFYLKCNLSKLPSELIDFCGVAYYDKNKTYLNRFYKNNVKSITGITPNDTAYIRFFVEVANVKNYKFSDYEFMLVEGATPKPYLPYGYIGLEQSGKNKLQYPYVDTTRSYGGITYTDNGDGSVTINGTATEDSNFIFSSKTVSNRRNIRAGKYKINGNPYSSDIMTITIGVTGEREYYQNNGVDTSFVISQDKTYYSIMQVKAGATFDNVTIYPMIRLETEEDTYEPYHEPKVIPINLNGNSIAKVGNVKDLLKVYRNGDVEIGKLSNDFIIDKDSNILVENDSFNNMFVFLLENINNSKGSSSITLSNYIKHWNNTWDNNGQFISWNNHFYLRFKNNEFGFNANMTNDEALTHFKEMLAKVPLHCYYTILEPQTIKLPSIEPIELWEGTNKFELITNLDTTFEMEYVVNKDYLETQNLLNIVEGENI